MELHILGSAIIYTAVLIHSTVSSQPCTSGFLDPQDVDNYDPSRLLPLLGRFETFGREQWIFFDLRFTCRGKLTRWMFRGLPEQDIGVELTTWRLNTQTNFITSYDQVSTTERNAARPTRNGSIFTYELTSPVEVLPGDIVGIEMGFTSFGSTSNNIIALNVTGSGSNFLSYRRSRGGPFFSLQSPLNTREQNYIPLLKADIEPPRETTTVMDCSTDSIETISISGTLPTRTEANPGLDNMDQSGGTATVAIVAAVCGGITGILFTVALCICVVCIIMRKKVHVHCDRKEQSESRHERNISTSSGTVLHMNMAYRQAAPNNSDPTQNQTTTEITEQCLQFNPAYTSQDTMQRQMDTNSIGDYEKMSGYVARHHTIPTQTEKEGYSHLALPITNEMSVQQGQSSPGEDNENPYEYIQ